MSITFTINGELHKVKVEDYPPDITLNTFLRVNCDLHGTKFMCLEGGCGACIVTIRGRHPVTKKYNAWAANSCLTLLNVCNEWDITTIEGIGNEKDGYHPIQEKLAQLGGSQCGYCSPGMVMNMYSLLEAKGGKVTMQEIENSFGGNLCRCTGYRPILDAMKSFANDSNFGFENLCKDIEDLGKCSGAEKMCREICSKPKKSALFDDGHIWYYPKNLIEVFDALEEVGSRRYILVAGNTGHGVYRRDESIRSFINVNRVAELKKSTIGQVLELGGNVTLTESMDIFVQASRRTGFEYCAKLAEHLDKVANVPVRNMGTIAGNLMLKHDHNEFPSDIFVILTTVGASVCIVKDTTESSILSLPEFLHYDMDKAVILKIILPLINKDNIMFDTYKITPRAQNAHAYVNASFLLRFFQNQIVESKLCFGGISPSFIEATATSKYLLRKSWITSSIASNAIEVLNIEINPDWVLPDASPNYRKLLACGLFYKFILKNTPSNLIQPKFLSGGYLIERPLSSGTQVFDTNRKNWPLNEPIPKIDALRQTSGEAKYMNDKVNFSRQLWAAFVHAFETRAVVVKIDPTEALKMKGVVAFYSAKDIPGNNSFVVVGMIGLVEDEELFCNGEVKYHSQPVGVIVAETSDLAKLASQKVKIVYEQRNTPVRCTIKEKLEYESQHKLMKTEKLESKNCNSIKETLNISGHFEMGGQYHLTMETQTTVCLPSETELTVQSSNHFHDMIQIAMANALNISENKINFVIRRLGGSYGAKATRPGQVAISCALAAFKLKRPVRFVQSLESNMATVGKRIAILCNYNLEINKRGIIQALTNHFYEDLGSSPNDSPMNFFTIPFIPNCYTNNDWNIIGESVITDAPSHTWMRSPGTLEAISMTENIMEHISRVVNRDPVDVRMDNIPQDSRMRTLLPDFVKSTSYRNRKDEINKFNQENRWKKKGIAISLMKYPINYLGSMPATVAIYHYDGTVVISHGGIEMGQGLNTKVIQVAAYTLGIPLSMIDVKPTNNIDGANAFASGGSFASETTCAAVRGACEILLERMKEAKAQLTNPTWVEITRRCNELNISLIATYLYKAGDLQGYDVWGLSCNEVEADILTGNVQLNRVDILQDTGESLSPLIDLGQIEGGYITGIGYWLTEKLVYNRHNGELLTNRTWNYKVPGAKDIPVDFRITLLQKSPNSTGFLRSKTSGELAICLAIGALFALRHALDSARADLNIFHWYEMGAPTTPEDVVLLAGHNSSNFTL